MSNEVTTPATSSTHLLRNAALESLRRELTRMLSVCEEDTLLALYYVATGAHRNYQELANVPEVRGRHPTTRLVIEAVRRLGAPQNNDVVREVQRIAPGVSAPSVRGTLRNLTIAGTLKRRGEIGSSRYVLPRERESDVRELSPDVHKVGNRSLG